MSESWPSGSWKECTERVEKVAAIASSAQSGAKYCIHDHQHGRRCASKYLYT
jgi:hypothetical protein